MKNVKRTEFVLCMLVLSLLSVAQPKNRFYPLKECGNDTLVYMNKNYVSNNLWFQDCLLSRVFENADIPFKSYFLAETSEYPSIVFVLLFTDTVEEVKKAYQSGQPVFGVFCNFIYNYNSRWKKGNQKVVYEALMPLKTNQFNRLDKKSIKALGLTEIEWVWYYDQKGWFSRYGKKK